MRNQGVVWVVLVAAGAGVIVTGAAGVFLYERYSLRMDRIRLREVRIEYGAAVSARQDRERSLDAKNPPKPLELNSERRARYGADAKWRELDKRAEDIGAEADAILDRWPELR